LHFHLRFVFWYFHHWLFDLALQCIFIMLKRKLVPAAGVEEPGKILLRYFNIIQRSYGVG